MLFTKLNDCCGFSNRCISLQLYAVNSQSHPKQGEADRYKLVELLNTEIQTYIVTTNEISGMLECNFLLTNQPTFCYLGPGT